MKPKSLIFLILLQVIWNILVGSILNAQPVPFPYTKPFPNCPSSYDLHTLKDISVKGPVKSIIQTSSTTRYMGWDESSRVYVRGNQTEYHYDSLGRLSTYTQYEVTVKDTVAFPPSTSTTLPILQQSTDQFSLSLYISYILQDGLLVKRTMEDGQYEFKFDKHRNLTEIYYFLGNRLVSETRIPYNKFNKPIHNENYAYGYTFTHKDPLQMTKAEKKAFHSITDAFDYDADGNMTAHKMNNGGKVYWMDRFQYDSVGNLIFEGRCEDFKGDVTSCKCKKFHINKGYEYDAEHRMTRNYSIGEWKPGGWDDYYEYNDLGQMTRQYK